MQALLAHTASDLAAVEAKGFLGGVGRVVLVLVILLILLGVVIGASLAIRVRRRR